jgi:hypothetical protein
MILIMTEMANPARMAACLLTVVLTVRMIQKTQFLKKKMKTAQQLRLLPMGHQLHMMKMTM